MRNVRVTNIHRGSGARNKYIYAMLNDAETGESIISATLEYVLKAISEREYNLVDVKQFCSDVADIL